MRQRADIAKHAVQCALNALRAARNAAEEALIVAKCLRVDPAVARAITRAAEIHLQRVDFAVVAVESAVVSANEAKRVIDQEETSHFGIPVLPPQLQAHV